VTEQALLAIVSNSFRSVWPLELLLLLRQEPQRAWRIGALVQDLRGSVSAVSEALAALRNLGLVSIDPQGSYHFEAASADLEELARELSDLYNRKPRAVMRAILAAPNSQIQTFADAFRLRKDTC
jgi:DNA-binding IclR family transcriptional regulator